VEIDAASNRGIDDIRGLKERINLAPSSFPYKVYIIDEVHMLTSEAFNALLKTLEEPPEHALFILCTTEFSKVPETIVSRCTRIKFARASNEEIVESLKRVAESEKLKLEENALEKIAESVDGSFRDGMNILEQLSLRDASGTGKLIKIQEVDEVLGILGRDYVFGFINALAERKQKNAYKLLAEIHESGKSYEQFLREVLEELRRLLMVDLGVEEGDKISDLTNNRIRKLLDLFMQAAQRTKFSIVPSLPLELAVADFFAGEAKNEEKDKGEKMELKKSATEENNPQMIQKNELSAKTEIKAETKPKVKVKEVKSNRLVNFQEIQKKWGQILENLRPKNHSLEALLKAGMPKSLNDEVLVVEVKYKFHKEQLELARYKSMVEETIEDLVGARLRLMYILAEANTGSIDSHDNLSGNIRDEEIIDAAEEIFS
jgi:DNA polymerase-3 subunit gamma/tau